MTQIGTRNRIGTLFLLLGASSCAGSHTGEDAAGAGAAGTRATAGAIAMAGKSAAGAGAGVAAGKGAAGAKSCDRTPAKHRASAMLCDDQRAPSMEGPMSSDNGLSCKADADCTLGRNGRCVAGRGLSACTYDECLADEECMGGGPCICGENRFAANRCMLGDCQTDADCDAHGYCSPSFGSCGGYTGVVAYYCHTCQDECVDDEDCAAEGGDCRYEPTVGHWKCNSNGCVG